MKRLSIPVGICTLLVLIGGLAVYKSVLHSLWFPAVAEHIFLYTEPAEVVSDIPHGSLLFVGDVMLARSVETLMRDRGEVYPFSLISDFLHTYTYVCGNFEGAIPKVHIKTRPMTFAFSIYEKFAPALANAGFTHMTLANNHAYDYGREGHSHAQKVLNDARIEAFGSPSPVTIDDVSYLTAGKTRIAIIPIYAVFAYPSVQNIGHVVAEASKHSDLQIVFIHWGEEYKTHNTVRQQVYAHAFVDMGVDAIIGHHPHVIENVEVYKNAPIFYSLGNFIFDQYWDESVKTGLTIGVEPTETSMRYALIPVYSEESAPKVLEGVARQKVLDAIASSGEGGVAESVRSGFIEVPRPILALPPQ